MNLDYYERLGIAKDASESEIQVAYRKLAKAYHPDTGTTDVKAFRAIATARDTLINPELRKLYNISIGFTSPATKNSSTRSKSQSTTDRRSSPTGESTYNSTQSSERQPNDSNRLQWLRNRRLPYVALFFFLAGCWYQHGHQLANATWLGPVGRHPMMIGEGLAALFLIFWIFRGLVRKL